MTPAADDRGVSFREGGVPIFGLNPTSDGVRAFLGTGGFITDGAVLLTADHVICDWTGPFGCAGFDLEVVPLEVVDRDPAHDLALLRTTLEHHPPSVLNVPPDCDPLVHTNVTVQAYEYGTTEVSAAGIQVNPAVRLGNITRDFRALDALGPAGDAALELSFPALRGASGAPVFYNFAPWTVVGVVVANHGYHLLPAQTESVLNKDNTMLEETKYLLPQAIPVHIKHLRPMYEKLCR